MQREINLIGENAGDFHGMFRILDRVGMVGKLADSLGENPAAVECGNLLAVLYFPILVHI